MLLTSLQGPGWCPWCGTHMTGWGWFMMMLFWLILLVIVGFAVWSFSQRGGRASFGGPREDRAEALLRERYARGEIDEETYHRMRDELRRDGA
jgi:putative membrane protein